MAGFNTVKKGGGFNVAKRVNSVLIQLGWDTSGPTKVDIDVHAFWLGANSTWIPGSDVAFALSCYNEGLRIYDPNSGKLTGDNHFPGNKRPFALDDLSLIHMGDALSGTAAVNIEEEIRANLVGAPKDARELSMWLTIHEAMTRRQNFGMMDAGFIQVVNAEDASDQLCRYDLTREFNGKTAIQLASFMKLEDGSWQFTAIGRGSNGEFMQIVKQMGYSG